MKKTIVIIITFSLLTIGCGNKNFSSNESNVNSVTSFANLPDCTSNNKGLFVNVSNENRLYHCGSEGWFVF